MIQVGNNVRSHPRCYPVPLQPGLVYGPIASKRLGRSLGINLSGVDRKLCNYNCVYCFYGRTSRAPEASEFPDVEGVLNAIEHALISDVEFDWLTFSGNGESTLHPNFTEIVKHVRQLVDKHRPGMRTALLSNGSTVGEEYLQATLPYFDLPIFKLDAGDDKTLLAINRPLIKQIRAGKIIEALHQLARSYFFSMQSVLFSGRPSNTDEEQYESWLGAIDYIRPQSIQLYTLDYPIGEIKPITFDRLNQVAAELTSRGVKVQVYFEEAN